jgi:hypothetical protein
MHRLLRWKFNAKGIERWRVCFPEVKCGSQLLDRPMLVDAIKFARQLQRERPDAIVAVVTDARDRFIRGPQYNGQASTDQPTASQLKKLSDLSQGIPLVTLLHPDAPFEEVRSYETNVPTMLGDAAGKKVGRPKKPVIEEDRDWTKRDIRLEKIQVARRLWEKRELSKREIGRRLGVPESTVRLWLK